LEGDGFELPVREHRAMAPSHGFAAASHREAALRGAPPPMARPRSEAQRGSLRPAAAMRSTDREMRCSAAVQAVRYRAARRAAMRAAAVKCRTAAVDGGYAMVAVWLITLTPGAQLKPWLGPPPSSPARPPPEPARVTGRHTGSCPVAASRLMTSARALRMVWRDDQDGKFPDRPI